MRSGKNKSQVRKLRKLKFWTSRRSSSMGVPRLCVFRSNKHIQAQIINDLSGVVVASCSSFEKGIDGSGTGREVAARIGATIGARARALGVSSVVFDRNGFVYHGRVASLAEAARGSGLQF